MEKYRNNTDIVDGIIAEKEAAGDYDTNPDCKSMRLYNCWDSSAVIKDDLNEESQEASKVADLPPEMAESMLSDTKLCFSWYLHVQSL